MLVRAGFLKENFVPNGFAVPANKRIVNLEVALFRALLSVPIYVLMGQLFVHENVRSKPGEVKRKEKINFVGN